MTASVTSIRKKTKPRPRPLTEAARNRLALDRADEIVAIVVQGLGLEEVDADFHEELQTFVLANYDADIASGRAL